MAVGLVVQLRVVPPRRVLTRAPLHVELDVPIAPTPHALSSRFHSPKEICRQPLFLLDGRAPHRWQGRLLLRGGPCSDT